MDRNDYCISVACFVTGFSCNCQTQNKNVYWMMQPLRHLGDKSVLLLFVRGGDSKTCMPIGLLDNTDTERQSLFLGTVLSFVLL